MRGDLAVATRLADLAARLHPGDIGARLHLAHVLMDDPTDVRRVDRSAEILAAVLREHPGDARVITRFVTNLITQADAGVSRARLDELISHLGDSPAETVVGRLRPLVLQRVALGDTDRPLELVAAFFDAFPTRPAGMLAHSVAVRAKKVPLARAIATKLADHDLTTAEDDAFLANESSFVEADATAVIENLLHLRQFRERRYSSQLVRAYREVGAAAAVLEYLDTTAHNLSPVAEAIYRYDALVALGRVDEAHEVAEGAAETSFANLQVFRNLRDSLARQGANADRALAARVRSLEADERQAAEEDLDINQFTLLITLYAELGLFDDVTRLADQAGEDRIGPASRRQLARAAYFQRRFDVALDHLERLDPATLTWDMEKLRGRVLLEVGDFDGALANRRRTPQSDGELDEVLYHTLLNLGEYEEAFSLLTPPADHTRLRSVFGDRWEDGHANPSVERRLVVSQAGPGDEIMLASTYSLLAPHSSQLSVTCEPRLRSLFERSFPDIEFLPVDRLALVRCSDDEERPMNVMHDLLTVRAMEVGLAAGAVRLSKTLGQTKYRAVGASPVGAYLRPEKSTVARFRERWGPGVRPIGLTWRSEKRSAQRDIHYLTTADLAPLLTEEGPFVNLQYDITPQERERLVDLCGERIWFLDDVDIRRDLDTTAALVASLEAVVGIGTTTTELSGAVGTPTVMIQPTHFGTWRATGPEGSDFWHRSVRVTQLRQPWRRPLLVEQARKHLLAILADAPRRP